MNPSTYSSLLHKIQKEVFASDKNSILRKYLQHNYFSAVQCVGIIDDYTHASDKVEALSIMAPKLVTLQGRDAKIIVKAFTFGDDQVKALRLIASHIYDPANKHKTLEAFTFSSDKDKARKILDNAVMTGAPPSCHPTSHCHPCPQPCAPYQPPQLQQGPYPTEGCYTQGGYSSPPQGAHAPPQGSYAPHFQGPYVPPPQVYPPPASSSGCGQPGYPQEAPPAGFNIQIGGMGGVPPPQPQQPGEINIQLGPGGFGLGGLGLGGLGGGGFGLFTRNISYRSQPPP